MVRLTIVLSAGSGPCAENLLDAFRFLIASTRLERGCRGCSTWAEHDSTVHYLEEWETETDMQRRIRSLGFTSLLSIMESAQGEPHMQFDFVRASRGIDYVTEIRGAAPS
jgi:quinol monooxygenase YgiN